MGIKRKGTLNYVKEKTVEEVELKKEDEKLIEETLNDIDDFLQHKYPPKAEEYPYCKKCAYYEYCFIREEE